MRTLKRIIALMAVLTLVATACGDDDATETTDAPATTAAATDAPATTAPATTAAAPAEPTAIRVQLNWTADTGFLGLYVADDMGYFAEEDVAPTFEYGGPNVPHPTQILAGGAADIGFGGLWSVAEAVNQGNDYVMLGARMQVQPLGISSLPDEPILTAADLCDKQIGLTPGDVVALDALLVVNGLEAGCYDMVPIGYDPSPLAEGLVAGLVNYMNSHPVILDAQGIENIAVSYGELGAPSYHDIMFVRRDFLDANRDAVVGFTRAMVKGWEYALENPQYAIDLMMSEKWGGTEIGMDPTIQPAIHEAQIPLITSDLTDEKGLFWMDLDALGGVMYNLLELGGMEPPPLETITDLSILEDAFDGCEPSILNC